MKVKHIITTHFLIALILLGLYGCVNTDLTRKIEAWQRRYPEREGDCMIYAMKAKAYYDRKGVPARICHGYWKGKPHAWCECQRGEVWLVDDPAVGNEGYEREAYGNYELTWWGE